MLDRMYTPDGRSNRERMLAGDQYLADDPQLIDERKRAAVLIVEFNATAGDDDAGRCQLLKKLLGSLGEESVIRPPFRCDYGYQTHVGSRTFANWGLVALDMGKITIGDDVQIGPNVTIGENTVVGAGSVVIRDLPANVVAVGNPARVVRGV
jgi:maltose O-acetyltransferase